VKNFSKIAKSIFLVFSIIWVVLILLEYINKHYSYELAFYYFRYTAFCIGLLAFIVGSWFGLKRFVFKEGPPRFNGLSLISMVLFFFIAIIFANKNYGIQPFKFSELLHLFGWTSITALILFVFFFVMRSVGKLIYVRLLSQRMEESVSLEIAIGIMLFTTTMFFLGLFGLLSTNNLILAFFIFTISSVTYLLRTIKDFLLKPIDFPKLGLLGYAAFLLGLFYLCVDSRISSRLPASQLVSFNVYRIYH